MTREEFSKQHKRCPRCFNKRLRVTLAGVFEVDGHYNDDLNTAICGCGWSGKVNELGPNEIIEKLIEWGKITQTGHIYIRDEVTLPKTRMLFGFHEKTDVKGGVSISDIAALGRPIVKDDGLYVAITVYDTPDAVSVDTPINEKSVKFLELYKLGYKIIPDGYGRIDGDGVTIRDYNLYGFYLRKEGYQ